MSINFNESQKLRIEKLMGFLPQLSASQLKWIEEIVNQFKRPHEYILYPNSNIVTDCLLQEIGEALRLHHCFSHEPFSKDKFEYLLERASNSCDIPAKLARKGNPGHDITIGVEKFSLKTQADRNIKRGYIHISKFMELGKGHWGNNPDDLIGLREQFFSHLHSYDRILVLRTVSRAPSYWEYQLVEIPKELLMKAKNGNLEMMLGSKQSPKPGYCYVSDSNNNPLFQLYFDGGTERKLQIKSININYCIIHSTWSFPADDLEIKS